MSDNLKSANSAKTGIIFSDARLDQKLTIDEVSDKTLINTKFIKAIESGDYTDFPSEGFARAYGWNGSTWVQLGGNIAEGLAGDQSGWSLSFSRAGCPSTTRLPTGKAFTVATFEDMKSFGRKWNGI